MKKKPSPKKSSGKTSPRKDTQPAAPKARAKTKPQKEPKKSQKTKPASAAKAAEKRKAGARKDAIKPGAAQNAAPRPPKVAAKKKQPAAAAASTELPEENGLPPRPTAAELGNWVFLTGEQSDEEARAMVDELWLLLNDIEKFRKLNPIGNIIGVHQGRKPEKVHLQFRGDSAQKVMARQWHPTENWRLNPNGVLDYWLEIAPCWQIKRWVLGFGLEGRVISPPEFCAVMRNEGISLMEKYGT